MKISIEREPLVDALGRMVPIASNKSPLPILANVYLRAGNEGHLTLDVSDLDWLQARIARRLDSMRPEITERRAIIRKR